MKYLAILKDSLYEALDTKVFYVMVGLSCLALLAVASVSYAPVTVEEEAQHLGETATWLLGMQRRGKDANPTPTVSVADFGETNPERSPYERDYHFTIVLQMPKAAPKDGQPDAPAEPKPAPKVGGHQVFLVQALARQQLEYLKDLTFTTLESADPGEVRLAVSSHGSKVTRPADWPHEPTLFFALPIRIWHAPVGNFVHFWEDTLVNTIGAAVTLLISAVITAFFIPNMLRKGTVDLLLVKPIHRTTLLIYKYIGGLAFMFLNTTFVVVGIWVILGLRTGLWGTGFLACIPVLTFQFALYYAVSTLAGVVTRSSIVAILMTCLA